MKVVANRIPIEVDDRGPRDAAPLLLIMGLGMQLVAWPEEFVEALLRAGFRVIRFDNRDAGLSQGFDHAGEPNLTAAAMRWRLGLPIAGTPYTLDDMADDAAGVLDAVGIASAHVCGASMGGMIAQSLAARQPRRVRSLTLVMTTSGARWLPQPSWTVQRALLARPRSRRREAIVDHLEQFCSLVASPAYPTERAWLRARLDAAVRRAWRPAGAARQLVAIAAHGDRTPLLERITAPTRVIHGGADPLVLPAAGRDLARKIDGAKLELIDGMGHDLPPALLPHYARSIAETAARA